MSDQREHWLLTLVAIIGVSIAGLTMIIGFMMLMASP